MKRALPFLLLFFILAAFVGGQEFREEAGFEFSTESIRAWVAGLGAIAPLLFVALVTFRNFVFLPSMVVLSAGGLVFGASLGTALGTLGIVISALMKFGLARGIGREWIARQQGERFRKLERRAEGVGPWIIGAITAYPTGPMTPFHYGAGLSSISLLAFALAIGLAAPLRAGAYSFFGSTLLAPGSAEFYVATGLLVGFVVLPLLHPRLRRRLFRVSRSEPALPSKRVTQPLRCWMTA